MSKHPLVKETRDACEAARGCHQDTTYKFLIALRDHLGKKSKGLVDLIDPTNFALPSDVNDEDIQTIAKNVGDTLVTLYLKARKDFSHEVAVKMAKMYQLKS